MLPIRRGSVIVNEGLLMKRSKNYVRVTRPTFRRILTARRRPTNRLCARLRQAELLTEEIGLALKCEQELPRVEVALAGEIGWRHRGGEFWNSWATLSMLTPCYKPIWRLAKVLSSRPPG